MTEADFVALEEYLGRPLPHRYRQVLAQYPLDSSDSNSRLALFNDMHSVLAYNSELREGEFAAEWQGDRLVIGSSPCGDSFFLDLSGMSPAVWIWDHETHAISEEAPDLDRFVDDWKRIEAEAKRRRKEATPARPWWQFWK